MPHKHIRTSVDAVFDYDRDPEGWVQGKALVTNDNVSSHISFIIIRSLDKPILSHDEIKQLIKDNYRAGRDYLAINTNL